MKIIIPGTPIAKHRPRFNRKTGRVYDDQGQEKNQTFLRVREQIGGTTPITGPVHVDSTFFMPRAKNHFGTGRNSGKLKPSAPEYHTIKPDTDNLNKFYWDILNKYVWLDDSQVVSESSVKKYCAPGEQPRTEIEVMELS
jgi:Holliday junction resolvase RusA-like endonuclease